LLEGIEVPFDDVPALVVLFVKERRPAADRTASFPMADLIGWFRDDSSDPASSQKAPDRSG